MPERNLPLVDLAAMHAEVGGEIEEAVLRVCRHQRFIGGAEVSAFESAFAEWLGARHVVGVANGTDAIELALRAAGVGPGDEVLLPANTFIATAEAVARSGARPRFADVDPHTGLIAVASCRERVTARTRAIIPVHLYGRMADMGPIELFAGEHGLVIVEDTAQAHGARRDGFTAGTAGAAGTFSFFPGKNLGAFGDAGAVATNDAELADRLRMLRDHGRRGRNEHALVGMNSRLDALQAAVLAVKLPHLERWTRARRRASGWYRELLPPGIMDDPIEPPEADVHHLLPILVDDRDAVASDLAAEGVATGVHYRDPLCDTAAFATGEPCPAASARAARQLSLPMHPHLEPADVERVASAVTRSLARRGAPVGV